MEKSHQKEETVCEIICKKNKTDENFELKKKYRNLATKDCRKAVKQFWTTKSEKIRENARDFFNTFQPSISNKTAKNNPISLDIDGNVPKNDAVAVAYCFADYFANVALNFGGQHVHDLLEEDHQYHTCIESINRKHHDAAPDFSFQTISETGVSDVTENVNPRKSSGWDSPNEPILLKKTASAIAPSLGAIFNYSVYC